MRNTCRFVWHDLNTHDVEGAKRFYGELFDWSFEQSGNEAYHHVKAEAQMIGGIRKETDEPGPPSWLGYVLVDDVIPTIGRFCAFMDPQNAALAVISFHPVLTDAPAGGIAFGDKEGKKGRNAVSGAETDPSRPPSRIQARPPA